MKFSVLISVYYKENARYFDKCLQSLFDQSLKPDEIVIVKDGPLGKDLDGKIEEWKKMLPIKFLQLSQNVGLGKALNEGIRVCSYDIIARMDSDDIALKKRFEKQVTYLKNNPGVSVIGAAIQEFEEDPAETGKIRYLPTEPDKIMEFSKLRNPLNHPTVVFRKSHIVNVGSYEHMDYFEDYYLWVKLLRKGYVIKNLNTVVLKFRTGNDMIGRRIGWSYVKKEYFFFKRLYKIDYLNFMEFMKALIFRIPLRLLPKETLGLIYKRMLRNDLNKSS